MAHTDAQPLSNWEAFVLATERKASMADPVPAGSDASAGTCSCTSCGYRLDVTSGQHLPPCPSCGNGQWNTMSGGDSVNDPYPAADPRETGPAKPAPRAAPAP
jgi:Zinc-ribbon containing domain